MSCPSPGPCAPFITQLNLCCVVTGGTLKDPCLTGGQPVPQTIIDNSIKAASELMWAYTGRQFGQCTAKIRPCKKTCGPCGDDKDWFDIRDFGTGFGSFPWVPSLDNGVWTNNRTDCGCQSSCCKVCELLHLPSPVCCIDEIKINGLVQGQSLFRIDNFQSIVRLGGKAVRTPLTGLTTVATGDHAMPTIVVSGPGVVYPNPSVAGAPLGGTGCGVWLPTDGALYTAQWSINNAAGRGDIFFEVCGSIGLPFEFDVLGIANGPIEVDILGGTDQAAVITQGGVAHVKIPASQFLADAPMCVRVRNTNKSTQFQELFIRPTNTGGGGLALCAVQWSDPAPKTDEGCWPECQNLSLPDTEPDTFSVTVTYGKEVPELIKLATATLACEFIKACSNQPCQLPQRLTSMTRQGVTVGFLDPQQFFAQGLTGIYLVDLAVKTWNPKGLQKQAYAYSPDIAKRWRTETGGQC